jgi:hypothetical protein
VAIGAPRLHPQLPYDADATLPRLILAQQRRRRVWVHVLADTSEADRERAGPLLAGGLAYRVFLWEPRATLLHRLV